MPETSFKLEKLKIKVFSKRQRMSGDLVDTIEAMFNPESYSLQYVNAFNARQGIDTSATELQYQASEPSELSLKLMIDGTGAIDKGQTGAQQSVSEQVKRFRRLTLEMNGDIHEPNYLIVFWGHLNFKCRLASVDIKYDLFDRSGNPIRAELDTHFIKDIDNTERVQEENKGSPDLTHVRIVRNGDTLPLLTQSVYGDDSYYLEVARFNQLNNFRSLEVGSHILFPPIVQS